jgi:hypothetical protein
MVTADERMSEKHTRQIAACSSPLAGPTGLLMIRKATFNAKVKSPSLSLLPKGE